MSENLNKWSGENPWLGLGSYTEGQRLYGRDQETAELTDIILNHNAIVVYGKSGIGKSSLLRAGVFPELRKQDLVPIYLRLEHNTDISYSQQVENAIAEHVTLHDLLPAEVPDMGLWDFMHRHRFTDTTGHAVTPVIVLDQFEEIFTLTQVEYKPAIQQFFGQLADLLNDVKPDVVIQAEAEYSKKHGSESEASHHQGFSLQIRPVTKWNYEKSPSYRFVFSIRDDSLYLLERNSAKIPALKVNRFNLNALDEENARLVIMSPRPDLFTSDEGQTILDELAYFEYDDFRVVDPAILSLFLYSYYQEQGKVSSTDIFERYYESSTHSVRSSSLAFIENHLLTDRGNRNQVPTEDIVAAGVAFEEIESLLQSKILKTEKRKGMDYLEFSHDRLSKQAMKHRDERRQREKNNKIRKRMLMIGLAFVALCTLISVIVVDRNKTKTEQLAKEKAYKEYADSLYFLNDSLLHINSSIKLSNDTLAKKDSINTALNQDLTRSNQSIEELRQKEARQNVLLSKTNKELDSKNKTIEMQKDSLAQKQKEIEEATRSTKRFGLCYSCQGSGIKNKNKCNVCNGTGQITSTEAIPNGSNAIIQIRKMEKK